MHERMSNDGEWVRAEGRCEKGKARGGGIWQVVVLAKRSQDGMRGKLRINEMT